MYCPSAFEHSPLPRAPRSSPHSSPGVHPHYSFASTVAHAHPFSASISPVGSFTTTLTDTPSANSFAYHSYGKLRGDGGDNSLVNTYSTIPLSSVGDSNRLIVSSSGSTLSAVGCRLATPDYFVGACARPFHCPPLPIQYRTAETHVA